MRLKPQHSFVYITLTGMLLFLLYPAETADGVHAAMGLCFNILLPTLFPISVCTGCLMRLGAAELAGKQLGARLGALFGCSGVGFLPICLGFLGGYPLGALVLSELYQTGRLSRREALYCSALCNHAGPGFLIGALGGKLLGSPARGLALISIQILSAWLVSLLMRQKSGLRARKLTGGPKLGSVPMSEALPEALETGALAMLRLTATVAFFGALTACLERMLPLAQLPQLAQAALVGALELSNGVSKLIGAGAEGAFILAAALTAWGGFASIFRHFTRSLLSACRADHIWSAWRCKPSYRAALQAWQSAF